MEKLELSSAWLDDAEDIIEEEETVFGGASESQFIQGYGVQTVKITMAKRIKAKNSETEWVELDFINQDGKTLREKFMVRGKTGATYFTKNGKKTQHFGINKLKSLLKVANVFPDVEAKKLMAALYGSAEDADVTYTEYGKEKTEEFLTFPSLFGVKCKIAVTSKKENSTTSADKDDEAEQQYVNQCIKDTKKFVIANPKKTSLKKFVSKQGLAYPNVYRWFVITTISHFIGLDDCFAGESEPKKIKEFLAANEEGTIFDGRTLIPENLTDKELKKLGINKYGKVVEAEEDDGYDDIEEPEVEEDADWN